MSVNNRKLQWQNEVLAGLQEIVAEMITELDLQAVLQKAVERTAALVEADIATIHIYDPLTDQVRAAAGCGLLDGKTFQQHQPDRGKVALLVASSGEPVIAEDVSASKLAGPFAARESVQSAAGFPLKVGDKVIGVLFVNYRKTHKFEPKEVETLVSFGNLAAVAIENANLIEQERQRADAMALLQQVSTKISASLDVEETLALIIEGAMQLTGTNSGVIHLVDETQPGGIRSHELPKDFGHLPPRFSEKKGLTWTIVDTGQVLAVSDISKDDRVNPEMIEKGVKAIIGVPLVVEGETIGALFLNDSKVREFTEYEKGPLSALAGRAAIAIQNARLLASLQRRAKGHRTLNKVGTMLTGMLDEKEILNQVASSAVATLDCTHCSVFLLEAGELVVGAVQGRWERDLHPGRTFKLGQGVAGWVAQTGQPALVPNTLEDVRFDPGWSKKGDPQSLVVVPISLDGGLYGVISVEHDRVAAFDEQDQRLLETLALQTSQAVRNARLHVDRERQIEQLRALNQISGELSAELDEQSIFEAVTEAVVRALDCTHCTVFRLENKLLVPRASKGKDRDVRITRHWTLGEGLAGWVAQHDKAILTTDARKDNRFREGGTRPKAERSMVVVPVKVKGQVVDVISADQDRVNAFDEQDLQMIETIALQTAIALQNAHLFKVERQRADAMDLLQEVSAKISATLDEKETLALIIEGAIRRTGTESGVIHLVDKAKQAVIRSYEVPEGFGHLPPRFSEEMGMTWTAVSTGQTIAVPDITRDERVNPAMAEKGVRAIIGTPLKAEEETIGVLFLNDSEPHEFTEYEKELVSTLASQAAIAIQNASLLKQERQRADAMALLQQVSTKISASLDVEETLALIIEGAMQLTGTNSGVIHLVDETQPGGIRSHELPKDFGHLPPRFSEKKGLTWTIVDTGQVLAVSDISKDDRVNPEMIEKGVKAIIGVPLVVEGETIGALFLNDSKVREFTEYEKGPLSALAGRAAIAIKNSQLFEDHEDRMDDLNALSRISHGLSSKEPLTVRDMSLLLHEEARDLMDLSNFYVASYDKGLDLVTFELAIEEGYEVKTGSGEWAHRVGGNGLTEQVIKRGELLYIPSDVGKWREEHGAYDGLRDGMRWDKWMESRDAIVTGQSWLGLPIKVGDEILGVIGVQNYEKADAYDEYDQKVLSTVAAQLGIAIVRQYLDRRNEELDRRSRELEVLTVIGRTVSNLGIDQILDLVYEQTAKIMNLSNAQVQIAFYDEAKDEVSFPLAVEQDAGEVIDVVRWSKREADYMKRGEDEVVGQFKPRARRDPPGLNECVIRTKEPLLIVEDFEQKAKAKGIQVWPTFGRLDRPTHSWLGVPMMVGGRVIGVISIQSLKQERAFDKGQQELLATVASQAAVAIENAKLYGRLGEMVEERTQQLHEAQQRIMAAERLAAANTVSNEFAHRLSNLAGTIPVRIDIACGLLDLDNERDRSVIRTLDGIKSDTQRLFKAAEDIRRGSVVLHLELININDLLTSSSRNAYIPTSIRVVTDFESALPPVEASIDHLNETLSNLISNAIDAMPEGGILQLKTCEIVDRGRRWVRLEVTDTGEGIPPEELKDIFQLFYTTKPHGLGYGLWRDRNLTEQLGGKLEVESRPGEGATFILTLPAAE